MFSKGILSVFTGKLRPRGLLRPVVVVTAALLLAACGSSEPTPTPVPPPPTNTSVAATPTEAPPTATEAASTVVETPVAAPAQAESPRITPTLTTTTTLSEGLGAPATDLGLAAFVRGGILYLQSGAAEAAPSPVEDCSGGKCVISHLRWSPKGEHLLYYVGRYDQQIPNQIRLVDTKGATQTVTSQAAYIQPAGWSPDGKEIVYRTDTDRHSEAGNGPAQLIQEVWTVALGEDGVLGKAKLHGEVNFGQGCGGGGRSESANVYERQGGFAYGYMSGITDWTSNGILLYSDNCSTRGVSRFDLNSNSALGPYPGNLRSLSLNAAGDGWVAIDGDDHLVTGTPEMTNTTVISTSAAPELVVYGQKTGTIYYTTQVVSGSVDLTQQVSGTLDPSIQVYPYFDQTIDGLVALDPATGKETPLYGNDGYAFALIEERGADAIVFSRVQDNSQLQSAVEKNELTAQNWRDYLPKVDVLMLKPGSAPTLLVGNAEQYTFSNFGANSQ